MKKHLIILSILPLASCSFLNEINPTGLDNVMETKALLESNTNSLYTTTLMWNASFIENYDAASGFWTFGQTGQQIMTNPDYTSAHRFTVYSTNQYNYSNFQYFYLKVGAANNLIENLKTSPVEESYKKELEAEARFVRAVAYFWAVRVFGYIPLRINAPTSEDAGYCPRIPWFKVYTQIIEDLKFAEQYGRTQARMDEIVPQQTRPNKFAATAYLSSVYVTIGSLLSHSETNFWDTSKADRRPDFTAVGIQNAGDAYRLALESAEKILPGTATHDPDCKYALVEKFGDLFQYTDEFTRNGYTAWKNPEQIFCHSTTRAVDNTVTFSRNTLPLCCPGTAAALNSTALNTGRCRPTRFIHQKWASTYPKSYGKGNLSGIVQSSTDPRMELSMYCSPFVNGVGSQITMYPYTNSGSQKELLPYLKKYWCTDYSGTISNATVHYMRLAEVYFNAAEAAAFLDDEATARKYVETVLARARHSVEDGQSDSAQPTWKGRSFSDKDELILAIFWERQFELLGEMHEYFDTHRFGAEWLADNIATPLNDFLEKEEQSVLFGKYYSTPQRRVFEEDVQTLRKSLLSPVPQKELDYNIGIKTNANDFWWGL